MPFRKRLRVEPTEDWSQLQFQFVWPEQITDERIRPVVLPDYNYQVHRTHREREDHRRSPAEGWAGSL